MRSCMLEAGPSTRPYVLGMQYGDPRCWCGMVLDLAAARHPLPDPRAAHWPMRRAPNLLSF